MLHSARVQVLISRNYRGDIEMNVIEKFMQLLLEKEDESQLSPIFQHGDVAFVYIKYNNVYRTYLREAAMGDVFECLSIVLVVCTTKINANVIMVLSFLYKCVRVFCEYFKELEEESIRDNFVIVYELLDELMDFGFPQSTDSKILQEYITQEGHKLEEVRPPPALTQTVSWRSDGLKYRKNEVFLDVIESVNLLVSEGLLSDESLPFLSFFRSVRMEMFFAQRSTERLKCVSISVVCLSFVWV